MKDKHWETRLKAFCYSSPDDPQILPDTRYSDIHAILEEAFTVRTMLSTIMKDIKTVAEAHEAGRIEERKINSVLNKEKRSNNLSHWRIMTKKLLDDFDHDFLLIDTGRMVGTGVVYKNQRWNCTPTQVKEWIDAHFVSKDVCH